MALKNLHYYFKQDRQSSLPNSISHSIINAMNKEAAAIISTQHDDSLKTQSKYIKITAKNQASIRRRIHCRNWEIGIGAAIRPLNETKNSLI